MDITLSVKRGLWRDGDSDAESSDKEFSIIRPRVLERDTYTCRFCLWKAEKWQDVHHLNDNHSDNRMENLVTVCRICHACFHIGLAGDNGKGGQIIFLPEVSQVELNSFMRAMLVVDRIGTGQERADVDRMRKALLERTAPVFDQWGTSNPTDFANHLMRLSQERYDAREALLRPLRLALLPLSPMLGEKAISYWAKCYEKIPPKLWHMLASTVYTK